MNLACALCVAAALFASPFSASAQGQETPAAIPGELRMFAISPDQNAAFDALHRAGWLEADGRLLRQQDFPELYARLGRAWTRNKASRELFAVPNMVDRRNEANPYGVLGPGDLLGETTRSGPPAPAYFIYAGRDARATNGR